MKGPFALLAFGLASIVAATEPHITVHHTTYVTITTCPITKTQYDDGTTKVITELTTSTITVTSCLDCEGITHVPGPTGQEYTTTEVLVTYTTICPITETITEAGTTYTITTTTTSTVETHVPTTIYETIHGPTETSKVYEGITTTITSLCPVTETKTIGGGVQTITYTTTSIYETVLPTTVQETIHLPESTTSVYEGITITTTSLCPITETTTIGGEVKTITYTSTSIYETIVPTTVHEYTTLAPHTTNIVTYVNSTSTTYCPITEIQTVSGHEVTVVHTSTSLIIEKVPTTIVKTITLDTTQYATSVVHETIKTIETDYTTVEAGSTVIIPTTIKSTILATEEVLITKTLEAPTQVNTVYESVTVETQIPVTTEVVEVPNESVVTIQHTIFVTLPQTIRTTNTQAPGTVTLPPVTATQSAPAQFTGAAAANGARHIAVALAGAAFALLA